MSVAAPIPLRSGDESRLRSLVRSPTGAAGLSQRARIVLLASQGVSNTQIAAIVGVSRPTVIGWRTRYTEAGIAGLRDLPRSGRPPTIDDLSGLDGQAASTQIDGVTHWSPRVLATQLGMSFASIARISRSHDLLPWKRDTFKVSTDPEVDPAVRDVVGLYLNPPEKAVVLVVRVDERAQSPDRTAPGSSKLVQPLRPVMPYEVTSDGVRHGATSLIAALGVARGRTDASRPRSIRGDFLDFLKLVAQAHPRAKLHVVADKYANLEDAKVKVWLGRNPRVTVLSIANSGSWMNMVEIFFGVTTRHAIRRGTVTSVKELINAIETFINCWNERCKPFMWTKTTNGIPARVSPGRVASRT